MGATSTLRTWLRAARPLAQANLALPLVLGAAAGGRHAPVEGWHVALLAAFSIADHLYIVFANDYADRAHDTAERTLFSGGSGVLVDGALTPAALLRAAVLAALALIVVGAAAWILGRPWALGASFAALALLFAYSYPPIRASYRGGGALLQAVGVGGVLPWLGGYVVSGDPRPDLGVLVPAMMLGLAGNITTAIPDVRADEAAGKRTLAVTLGAGRARVVASLWVCLALGGLAYHSTNVAAYAVIAVALPLALQRPDDSSVRAVVWLGLAATAAWVGLIAAQLVG